MTREKIESLKKYIAHLQSKLEEPVPEKHENHRITYHEFLRLEIKKTKAKIDEALVNGVK